MKIGEVKSLKPGDKIKPDKDLTTPFGGVFKKNRTYTILQNTNENPHDKQPIQVDGTKIIDTVTGKTSWWLYYEELENFKKTTPKHKNTEKNQPPQQTT